MGAVRLIITAMRVFPEEQKLQEAACAALMNCSGNIYGAIEQGAADEVLRCMETFPENVKIQTKCCLLMQIYGETSYGAFYFVQANAGQLIYNAMKLFPLDLDLQSSSCAAIWYFCSHSSKSTNLNKTLLSSSETSRALLTRETIWQLQFYKFIIAALTLEAAKKNDDLTRNALGALWALDHPITLGRAGVHNLLFKVLKNRKLSSRSTTIFLNIVARLASIESNALALTKLKAPKKLSSILKEERFITDKTIIDSTCHVLAQLSFWEFCKKPIFKTDSTELGLNILNNYATEASLVQSCIKMFANLATVKEHAELYFEKKIPTLLIEVATTHIKIENIANHTVSFVRNMSFYDEKRVLPLVGSIKFINRAKKYFEDNDDIKRYGNLALERMKLNRKKI